MFLIIICVITLQQRHKVVHILYVLLNNTLQLQLIIHVLRYISQNQNKCTSLKHNNDLKFTLK